MEKIGKSELILNDDGSIYHLHLKPENISDTIILVGDQDRVDVISSYFDSIEFKVQNREFRTHTGTYKNKRLTVMSTGIGTDNVDIVINELDALVNIDLKQRIVKETRKSLNFVRIGTSGALQENIPVDTFIISNMAVGFDGLLNFYENRNKVCDTKPEQEFIKHTDWNKLLTTPYFVEATNPLFNDMGDNFVNGITISAPGFYGPQCRKLRISPIDPEINNKIRSFNYKGLKITNYEMESSAIFGLSKLMGHKAITACLVLVNRIRKEQSKNYRETIKKLIVLTLDKLANID